jgi:SAM-dependent methyltransferase
MDAKSYREMCDLEKQHWWFVARRSILEFFVEKNTKPLAQILEIGAGTGGNLEMLMRHGKVTAIEPNDFAREKIREKFGEKISMIKGSLPSELGLQNQGFDLICLFDVLEHVEEDLASLSELKKFLNPNGKIIITVPAFQFLWSLHDEKLHHHRRYNLRSLKNLIKDSGFAAEKITYFNCILFPLAASIRLFEKIIHQRSGGEYHGLPPFNKFLTMIFSSEKFWLKKFNFCFGLSLLCVLKKD